MEIKKTETEILEGQKEEPSTSLGNTPVPTEEEEQAAGIENGPAQEQTLAEGQEEVTSSPEPQATGEADMTSDSNAPVGPEIPKENVEGSATKMFTQSQVDEIAGNIRKETREKERKNFLSRYGVTSEEELDDLFGRAQGYDTVKEEFDGERKAWEQANAERDQKLTELSEQVALLQSGIDQSRFEDAKLILRGKGLEVTIDNINAELATHPEWKPAPVTHEPTEAEKAFKKKDEPATRIDVLGNDGGSQPQGLTEKEEASKLWNLKF